MSALLSVSDAHVSYGKVEAVRSVSLDVADNEIVTIIGANGAGKTTLLNAIMGVLPLKGATTFAGDDMAPFDIEDRVAAGSKRTTASTPMRPFLVPPKLSASTPARQVISAGVQPSVTRALAKRAPSMWTREPKPWATSVTAWISSSV